MQAMHGRSMEGRSIERQGPRQGAGSLKGGVQCRAGLGQGAGSRVGGRFVVGSRSVAGRRCKMQEMQEQVHNAKLGRSNIAPCCSQMTFHFLG